MSIAAIMVHLDAERDCEQRVQVALDLADRFQATLIGVAGLSLRPAFAAGGVVVYGEPTQHDHRTMRARFDEMGKKFCVQGQHLKQVEWRTALELPSELVAREARAADVVLVGQTRTGSEVRDLIEPGVILLRAGRPILVWSATTTTSSAQRIICRWVSTSRGLPLYNPLAVMPATQRSAIISSKFLRGSCRKRLFSVFVLPRRS